MKFFVLAFIAAAATSTALAGTETSIGQQVTELQKKARDIIDQFDQNLASCQRASNSDVDLEACRQAGAASLALAQTLFDESASVITGVEFEWQLVDEGPSPIDDSPTLTLTRKSRAENSCSLGDGINYVVMRCHESQTVLYFYLEGCRFSGRNEAGSTGVMRIGTEAAQTYDLAGNGPNFQPKINNGTPPLIISMFGQDRLVFRAQPFAQPQQTIIFDITGIEDAVTPLRDACGW